MGERRGLSPHGLSAPLPPFRLANLSPFLVPYLAHILLLVPHHERPQAGVDVAAQDSNRVRARGPRIGRQPGDRAGDGGRHRYRGSSSRLREHGLRARNGGGSDGQGLRACRDLGTCGKVGGGRRGSRVLLPQGRRLGGRGRRGGAHVVLALP